MWLRIDELDANRLFFIVGRYLPGFQFGGDIGGTGHVKTGVLSNNSSLNKEGIYYALLTGLTLFFVVNATGKKQKYNL